ncbi:MAG: putative DNA-binding domain-containing protein, partial [Asticcacaulis sp.]|nr:putative DNA-binding domain-containing protein [Asticcacaulis sp.]
MFDATSLAGFQRDFLQAVIAANPPQHSGLRIHHDTWLFGLIDALAGVYPATHHVLGDEAFKAFSRDYVRNRLLTSGDCTGYGGEFPTFLAQHPRLGD